MSLSEILSWWPAAAALWLLAVNLRAFDVYRLDKRLAVEDRERVPESRLLSYVVWGGGAGALAAMLKYRHKTRKQPFQRQFWSILATQAALAFGVLLAWIVLH